MGPPTWWHFDQASAIFKILDIPDSDFAFADDILIGRESDLALLGEHIYSHSVTILAGQPGVGKTHLIAKYIRQLLSMDVRGIRLVWLKLTSESLLEELVAAIFGSHEATGVADEFRKVPAGSASVLAYSVLEELKRTPYLLTLDNFEMLMNPALGAVNEPGYAALYDLLTHHSIGSSRVLIGSWWIPRDSRGRRAAHIELEGLTRDGVESFLAKRDVKLPKDRISLVASETAGNPLALEITLATLRKGEFMPGDELSAMQAVRVAFQRLDIEDIFVLAAVAISVDESSEDLIRYVLRQSRGMTDAKISRLLDDLTSSKLLMKYRWDTRSSERRYSVHTLIRRYTLETALGNEEVASLHRHAMDYWYERGDSSNTLTLFWVVALRHALNSGQYLPAKKLLLDTGLQNGLFDSGRYGELIGFFEQLLDIKRPFASLSITSLRIAARDRLLGDDFAPLLKKAAHTYWRMGYLKEAKACFRLLTDELQRTPTDLAALSGVMFDSGENAVGMSVARQALYLAEQAGDRYGEMEAWSRLGVGLSQVGPVEECIRVYNEALRLSGEFEDVAMTSICEARVGMVLWKVARTEEARPYFERAYELAVNVGEPYLVGLTEGDMGHYYMDKPDSSESDVRTAEKWYQRALKTHRAAGVRRGEGFWLGQLGRVHARRGEYAEAQRRLREAVEVHLHVGEFAAIPRHLWYLGQIYGMWRDAGWRARSAGYLRAAIEHFAQCGGILEMERVKEDYAALLHTESDNYEEAGEDQLVSRIAAYLSGFATELP